MVKNLTGKMVIAEGALFDGKIRKADEIEVYGSLTGTVSADKIEIGVDGSCIGNIRANSASLSGTYDGNLVSVEVFIQGSAQVNGTIKYHSLQMDRGAELNCRLTKMKKVCQTSQRLVSQVIENSKALESEQISLNY